eukprot:COSAG02_NODE_201_length_29473_cov_135.510213_5_plen_149_part_00
MIAAFSRGFLPKLALFPLCFGLTSDFRASNPRYEFPLLQSRITYRKVAGYLYIKTLSSIRVYTVYTVGSAEGCRSRRPLQPPLQPPLPLPPPGCATRPRTTPPLGLAREELGWRGVVAICEGKGRAPVDPLVDWGVGGCCRVGGVVVE